MKSRNLTEEELRLALWAYLQREDASISKSGAGVHWLSAALKQLPIHPNESRPPPDQFRTREELTRRLRELTTNWHRTRKELHRCVTAPMHPGTHRFSLNFVVQVGRNLGSQ
jgi:hypothetical protein